MPTKKVPTPITDRTGLLGPKALERLRQMGEGQRMSELKQMQDELAGITRREAETRFLS